jgi:hypothetical protein
MRLCAWVRLHFKSKPYTYTGMHGVDMAEIRGKVECLTEGDLLNLPKGKPTEREAIGKRSQQRP